MATLLSLLPLIILGPVSGALVDRWNRRILMIAADGVVALASLWLVYLFWADALVIWQFYVVMVIRAVGHAYHWSSNQASISLMVPKEQFLRIVGLNKTFGGAAKIISPMVCFNSRSCLYPRSG